MRFFLLFFCTFLVISCRDAQKDLTNKRRTVKKEIKGLVKRIEDYSCLSGCGSNIKLDSTGSFTITFFDKNGKDTAFYNYDSYNKLFFKRINKFDTSGFLVSSQTIISNRNNTETKNYTYSNNWKIKNEITNTNNEILATEYEYDDDGNELKEYYYFNGVKSLVCENSYDNLNHKIESRNFNDGKNISTIKIKTDSLGNPLEIVHDYFSIKRIAYSYFFYKYDAKGNWIERIEKNEYGDLRSKNRRVIDYY